MPYVKDSATALEVDILYSSPIYLAQTVYTLEEPMITMTETARKELDAYFADKEKSSVRVYMAAGG